MNRLDRLFPIGFERSKFIASMKARGLTAVLLTSPENVFYTTGYTALPSSGNPILYMLRNRLPFFSFITADGSVTLLCWGFATWNMEFGADRVVGFNNLAEGVAALRSIVADSRAREAGLGIESSCPYFVLDAIDAISFGNQLAVIDGLVDELRLKKTAAEVECLQRSVDIIEATCGQLYDILRVGMGRSELMREARTRLLHNGADGISHLTFSFGQSNPEFDIDEALERNRLVTLDLGAIYRGYCSDNRRYAYSGKMPSELRERYQQMVEIVDGVGAALVPGTSYRTLMELAASLYAKHGVEPLPRFNHVGHNIGLETEERWLDDDPSSHVQAGMVINIELYSMTSTGDQIGDEETYVISPSGPSRISRLPREIRELNGG
jgi:Xaa-Pro aminopeptidase